MYGYKHVKDPGVAALSYLQNLIMNIFKTLMISSGECVSLIEKLTVLPNLLGSLFHVVMMI